jgi:hypothetical protein
MKTLAQLQSFDQLKQMSSVQPESLGSGCAIAARFRKRLQDQVAPVMIDRFVIGFRYGGDIGWP